MPAAHKIDSFSLHKEYSWQVQDMKLLLCALYSLLENGSRRTVLNQSQTEVENKSM